MYKLYEIFTVMVFCAGLLCSLWSCAILDGIAFGPEVDDTAIVTKIKTLLVENPYTGGFPIGVQSSRGKVTLTGTVDSADTKEMVGEMAQSVPDVRKVKNLVQIQ